VGLTDETTALVTLRGWLDREMHERGRNIPARPNKSGDTLVAIYGMSFAARLSEVLAKVEPRITVRFWGGPAAPPNHAYAAYLLDRGHHNAQVVMLGIAAHGPTNMGTFTNMNRSFEYPLPYTYPRYHKVGDQLQAFWPSVRTMADFRRVLNDEALWKNYVEEMKVEDDYYHPLVFHKNFIDNFATLRFIRRSWAKRHIRQLRDKIHDSSGFNENAEEVQVIRLIVKEFARQARSDGQLPILLLFNTLGYADHLYQTLADTITQNNIPTMSTHLLAPADDPKNIASDNFHFSRRADERFSHAILDIINQYREEIDPAKIQRISLSTHLP
jgi:hypothetical protein